jgi:hypothetical protein
LIIDFHKYLAPEAGWVDYSRSEPIIQGLNFDLRNWSRPFMTGEPETDILNFIRLAVQLLANFQMFGCGATGSRLPTYTTSAKMKHGEMNLALLFLVLEFL